MISYRYLALCGHRLQGCRGGVPEEILVLLIVNVPSVVGATGKLMEARGLFRLEIVELGLCVFGIPAEGQSRDQTDRKREKDLRFKDFTQESHSWQHW